jgi:hypothetical protein
MADKVTTATLTVTLQNGTARHYRFELASDAPLNLDELRGALVSEFVSPDADASRFDLVVGGTLGAPAFTLRERKAGFIRRVSEENGL